MTPDCSTPLFSAPEQLSRSLYSTGVDVWAAGCCLVCLWRDVRSPYTLRLGVSTAGSPSIELACVVRRFGPGRHLTRRHAATRCRCAAAVRAIASTAAAHGVATRAEVIARGRYDTRRAR